MVYDENEIGSRGKISVRTRKSEHTRTSGDMLPEERLKS